MKKAFKRALSVVLAVVMIMTSAMVGLEAIAFDFREVLPEGTVMNTDSTIVKPSTVTNTETPRIIAPEQIYLAPDALSWNQNTSTPFQYYANNDANGDPVVNTVSGHPVSDRTGQIYVTGLNANQYASATLSAKVLTEAGAAFTGSATSNIAKVNNTVLTDSNSVNVNTSAQGVALSITGGQSPSLAKATNGYYILWKVQYRTSGANSPLKSIYALTYVYKPNTIPVSAATEASMGNNKVYSAAIIWLTGFHSIGSADYRSPTTSNQGTLNYRSVSNTERGFAVFANEYADDKAYIGGTEVTPTATTSLNGYRSEFTTGLHGKTWNQYRTMPFATSTIDTNAGANTFFLQTNIDAGKYSAGGTYKYKDPVTGNNVINARAEGSDGGNGKTGWNYKSNVGIGPGSGVISVDTSRYSSLDQIPNLNVGFAITNTETADHVTWKVADVSEKGGTPGGSQRCVNFTDDWFENPINRKNDTEADWGDDDPKAEKRMMQCFTPNGIIAGQYEDTGSTATEQKVYFDGKHAIADAHAGLRYVGPWAGRSIITDNINTYTPNANYVNYYVSGVSYVCNSKENAACSSSAVNLQAKQIDKSDLRDEVETAANLLAKLGVCGYENDKLVSLYFPATDGNWTNFSDKYLEAYRVLTNLTATAAQVSSAETDLSTAITGLHTTIKFDENITRAGYTGVSFNGITSSQYLAITADDELTTNTVAMPVASQVTVPNGFTYAGVSLDKNANWNDDSVITAAQRCGFNETYYVILEPNEVHFTFNMNGADSAQIPTFDTRYMETPGHVLTIPTKRGYDFKGFWDEYENEKIIDENGDYVGRTGDNGVVSYTGGIVDLTAHWNAKTYRLTALKDDDNNTEQSHWDIIFGNPMPTSMIQFENRTANGSDFKGYFIKNGNTVTATAYTDETGAIKQEYLGTWDRDDNLTVQAVYGPCKYDVVFDNGSDITEETREMTYGAALPTFTPPARPGYTLVGYYTGDAQGHGTPVYAYNSSSNTCTPLISAWNYTSTFRLYAKWEKNTYTFKYTNDHNRENDETQNVWEPIRNFDWEQNLSGELIKPDDSASGYKFMGYDSKDHTTTYINEDGRFTQPTWVYQTSIVAYAKWEARKYTISFNNGDGVPDTSLQVIFGEPVTGITAPTKTGYTFEGYKDDNGNLVVTFDGSTCTYNGNYNIVGNQSLTADWEPIKYNVVFVTRDINGNRVDSAPVRVNYGTALPDSEQVRVVAPWYDATQHHTFNGTWYKDNTTPFAINSTITADTVLWAQYTNNPHDWTTALTIKDTTSNCMVQGEHVQQCSCGYEKTTLKPLDTTDTGHDWVLKNENYNCTTGGTRTYECSRNSAHTKTETIPAGTHRLLNATNYQDSNGAWHHSGTCSVCGQVIDELCYGGTSNCQHGKVCTVCSKEYTAKSPTVHAGTSKTTTIPAKAATCGVPGNTAEIVWDCCYDPALPTSAQPNAVYQQSQTISATGNHSWSQGDDVETDVPGTCTQTGTAHHYCKVCGESMGDQVITPAGHEFDGQVREKHAATCTTARQIEKYCSRCGQWIEEYDGTPLGHNFVGQPWLDCPREPSDPEFDPQHIGPWCEEEGWQYRVCSRGDKNEPGYKEFRQVDGLVHDWELYPAKEPDCSHTGTYEAYKCKRCGIWKDNFNPNDPANVIPMDPDKHTDYDHDGYCDDCDREVTEDYDYEGKCGCICHMAEHSVFCKFIYAICRLFWRLFNYNRTCICGQSHWEVKSN